MECPFERDPSITHYLHTAPIFSEDGKLHPQLPQFPPMGLLDGLLVIHALDGWLPPANHGRGPEKVQVGTSRIPRSRLTLGHSLDAFGQHKSEPSVCLTPLSSWVTGMMIRRALLKLTWGWQSAGITLSLSTAGVSVHACVCMCVHVHGCVCVCVCA